MFWVPLKVWPIKEQRLFNYTFIILHILNFRTMKKNFNNLSPSKKKKVSDAKIDDVLRELDDSKPAKPAKIQKQRQIQFNVKLPENLYNALDEQAKKTGLSKKAILVGALWDKLG